ncbi:hypothetical protein GUJ93_ZPchr0006g44329 [Zizania palustris]|uniref:Very-long-chain aldehyde decarbonylase CER1-like C-terminal domain-containing protein n=1 Tax=Zizania palustris TaxID=103762 RepID=A0A8J5SV11_ZIZPA|nr:hypothetical protein GUJ93_ZPchr0006g44329 [Zizania palustris]
MPSNEALNGGGTLFVNKYPDLRVRVVHRNTLTAAVILNEIPCNANDVFLTGATSKLGRAIALYLYRKKIRVLVSEDPEGGAGRVPAVSRAGRQVPGWTKLQDVARGQVTVAEGAAVGAGWHVLPPVRGAADHRVPARLHLQQARSHEAVQGRRGPRLLRATMAGKLCSTLVHDGAGVVHACHAGGVVHFLEGWDHHEVGAIDVNRIDVVWQAALKHGFTLV